MSDQFYNGGQPAPFSQEAEEAVLGSLLTNPNVYFNVASFLKSDDFFLLRHQWIWQAIERITERNEEYDYLTVSKELQDTGHIEEIGGVSYLLQLVNNTPSSAMAEVYGKLVQRAATRRRLLTAAEEIRELALDEELSIERVTDEAENRMFAVTESQVKKDLIPMRDAINEYFGRIEHLMVNQDQALGLPTGFRSLDTLLGGLQRSDLMIFAGRPGMGKCVAAGTLVNTENGLLPIEQLKPQNTIGIPDEDGGIYYPLEMTVQTPDGPQRTAYFYDSGIKPTLRLTTRAGYSLTGTYPHPVLTLSPTGEKVWKTLADLRSGDFVAVESREMSAARIPAQPRTHQPTVLVQTVYAPEVTTLLEPRFYWDEITQIEPAGEQHCYDLTVPEGHAFVTNGIVSHNTSFMLSVALNIARYDKRIAIFTMEMGVEQIVQRLVSMETGINMQRLRLGQVDNQEWSRLVEAMGRLSSLKIFIDDTPALTPLQMRTKCRRLAREHGIDLVIVDYLQLMNAGTLYENNRVQEISYISRSLKELARELNVPLFSAAQLSRAVEQRADKRPQLSDLRESGCLAGESPVYLPDEGRYVPIADLCGQTGFRVLSLNPTTYKLEPAEVSNAFCTGVKPVYRLTTQLGRTIRATANHKFLTIHGWKRLDELSEDDHIALPRTLTDMPEQTMSDAELALLGHLIGDGCTLPRHAIQYTTREPDLAETVAQLATSVFGAAVTPRIHQEPGRSWYQVFITATQKLTHGKRSPVRDWLDSLGVFGLRSHEKRIPDQVFAQPNRAIALFLRHLWATDGCMRMKPVTNGYYPNIYYASSSEVLAKNVQSLLLRLGINAACRRISQAGKGLDQYHVNVSGKQDIERFVEVVGAVGAYKQGDAKAIQEFMSLNKGSSKRDFIPSGIWETMAIPVIQSKSLSLKPVLREIGMARYAGTTFMSKNLSREQAVKLAEITDSSMIFSVASSDVYWDGIVSIEPDGETEVYDLTVPYNHNFLCSNIVTHNSIEQDADIVMFLYRDEVYNEATEYPNQADVIVAKHRNGPTDTISLYFDKTITRFLDARAQSIDLSRG